MIQSIVKRILRGTLIGVLVIAFSWIFLFVFVQCDSKAGAYDYPEKYTAHYFMENYEPFDGDLLCVNVASNFVSFRENGSIMRFYKIEDVSLEKYSAVERTTLLFGDHVWFVFRAQGEEENPLTDWTIRSLELIVDEQQQVVFETQQADVIQSLNENLQGKTWPLASLIPGYSKDTNLLPTVYLRVWFEENENIFWQVRVDKVNDGSYYTEHRTLYYDEAAGGYSQDNVYRKIDGVLASFIEQGVKAFLEEKNSI